MPSPLASLVYYLKGAQSNHELKNSKGLCVYDCLAILLTREVSSVF